MSAACRELENKLKAHSNDGGFIGNVSKSMTEPPKGMYAWPDGSFRTAAPPEVKLAEVQEARCFQTESYSVGDRGLHSVTEQPRHREDISLPRYLASSDAAWITGNPLPVDGGLMTGARTA